MDVSLYSSAGRVDRAVRALNDSNWSDLNDSNDWNASKCSVGSDSKCCSEQIGNRNLIDLEIVDFDPGSVWNDDRVSIDDPVLILLIDDDPVIRGVVFGVVGDETDGVVHVHRCRCRSVACIFVAVHACHQHLVLKP